MLRLRPDVARAEAQTLVAAASLGAARADLLPRLNLTGSINVTDALIGNPAGAGTTLASATPFISIPLFDWGRRFAVSRQRDAQFDQSLIQYRQTVTQAVAEASNALVSLDQGRLRLDRARAPKKRRRRTARGSRAAYRRRHSELGRSPARRAAADRREPHPHRRRSPIGARGDRHLSRLRRRAGDHDHHGVALGRNGCDPRRSAVDFTDYGCNCTTITGVNMSGDTIRVSTAESVIMEALWKRHPLSADDIVADVAQAQGWTEATVKTLINRLLTKDAIGAERDGRRYLYSPKIERADYVSEESRNLIDRLFDGRLSSLVTHFSEREQLSADDIAELKRLIGELDNER